MTDESRRSFVNCLGIRLKILSMLRKKKSEKIHLPTTINFNVRSPWWPIDQKIRLICHFATNTINFFLPTWFQKFLFQENICKTLLRSSGIRLGMKFNSPLNFEHRLALPRAASFYIGNGNTPNPFCSAKAVDSFTKFCGNVRLRGKFQV